MTLLFQKWRLSNLQEGIIVAQYLCSYKFPAILKWLSGESEFIDLKLQFSSYIIHRCDERGDVCSRYILCFRSADHTAELQSRGHLVCRLLLRKRKTSKGLSVVL